ncbi:sulfotransferase [Colwelliaceae bacterium 6441]
MKNLSNKKLGIKGKIFCLSMQRNGTSSVGDFFQNFGLNRVGSPISNKKRWPLAWYNGDFEAIFNDETFIAADVLEDDPWWFTDFYKVLYHRFPNSKFILVERDADSWFKSMIRHSNGFSVGVTEVHCKLYRREDEYSWLKANIADFGTLKNQEMVLYDKAQHYCAVYERYNREVKDFFARVAPDALFTASIKDETLWGDLANWLNIPGDHENIEPVHAHKGKGVFAQKHLLVKKNYPEIFNY